MKAFFQGVILVIFFIFFASVIIAPHIYFESEISKEEYKELDEIIQRRPELKVNVLIDGRDGICKREFRELKAQENILNRMEKYK